MSDTKEKAVRAAAMAIDSEFRLHTGGWMPLDERQPIAERAIDAYETALWQLIETAPKDGTLIDLWGKHDLDKKPFRLPSCLWKHDAWYSRERALYVGRGDQYQYRPTHWRPVPEGPKP